jgi:hypothetical protein
MKLTSDSLSQHYDVLTYVVLRWRNKLIDEN